MNLYRVLGIVFLCVSATSCFAQNTQSTGYFTGKWVVTDVVDYAHISGGLQEAKRLLGKSLSISKSAINFDEKVCKLNKGFTVDVVDTTSKFNAYYGIKPDNTGLPGKTLLLESSNCTPIFKMDESRVVFGWNGVIVRAVTSNPKHGS